MLDSLQIIIILVIEGEKREQIYFDDFIEGKIFEYFPLILEKSKKVESSEAVGIQIELLKLYNFFLTNMNQGELMNYIFSQGFFNEILKFDFDFSTEEIDFFFIGFAQSIVQRFGQFPLEIFYNLVRLKEEHRVPPLHLRRALLQPSRWHRSHFLLQHRVQHPQVLGKKLRTTMC